LKSAYVDSSCLVAIALGEPGSREILERLSKHDKLFSSHLLEAELRSALARVGDGGSIRNLLSWFLWVLPPRRLTQEIGFILDTGYLKGPDLWHLSCALFLRPRIETLSFLTIDGRQGEVARALGFRGL
jgi:PIN domain-containing protein